jgi:uncharacterized protein (DUF1501 family)
MSITRRAFMKQGALALFALGLPPEYLTRSLLAETRGAARKKTVIFIFQRGAVDGLSMVAPFGDPEYFQVRRSIALSAPTRGKAAVDLDGHFALHPSLSPLADLYGRREMGVVHAVGFPNPTRSHFDAQDNLERGTPGVRTTPDGWMNRFLGSSGESCAECDGHTLANPRAHAADHAAGQAATLFRGVAATPVLPLSLRGAYPTLAIGDLSRFGVAGGRDPDLHDTFARLYRTAAGDEVSAAAQDGLEAELILKHADPARYTPRPGVEYPAGDFGRSLRQIAQLVKADVGVEVAFTELSGWDTHVRQGGESGQLAARLSDLGRGIRALYDDLGDRMDDVVIVTMSEFGRTVAENGTGGTDHGHANCMLVLGGSVRGGRVLGEWPGLAREKLYEGRDLAMTTDFRDVFAEVLTHHLHAGAMERVFPGYAVDPRRFRGVV